MATETETTPRKQPRQARSRATVDAILTATAQVLVEAGYDKATTNMIARRAGVSIGSLYQYFPNKEALVAALCDRHMDETTQSLLSKFVALRHQPLEACIRSLIRMLLEMHAREPVLHRVLIEQIPRLSGFERIARLDNMMIEVIKGELASRPESVRPTDLEMAAFIIVHSVQAVTHAAVLDRPHALDDAALAEETAQLVLRYLLD
jgi:AcrR family transcriptional regulator